MGRCGRDEMARDIRYGRATAEEVIRRSAPASIMRRGGCC